MKLYYIVTMIISLIALGGGYILGSSNPGSVSCTINSAKKFEGKIYETFGDTKSENPNEKVIGKLVLEKDIDLVIIEEKGVKTIRARHYESR
ncbi:hypothetical protein [Parachitinimonas caeni]|uniref:Uncharacterized protein n=1 Tax=Parachitinimonas caeni TaxID=3031301 RepID=A0ABT7E4X9_9NEIS|nr:hypothetical protein [Parachitinimonas caeni]MDK2126505.1 hypothetical protein [Parachitinimonas caeni]